MGALDDVDLFVVDSLDMAWKFKNWLGERRPVLGVDTETSGLEWWNGRLRLVQYGDANTGWAIPAEEWLGLIREVQREYREPMTLHNAPFDMHWFREAGAPLRPELVDDTLLAYKLTTQAGVPIGLKPLSETLIDPDADLMSHVLHDAMKKQKWTWDTVPASYAPYALYSALDPVLAARLWELKIPELRKNHRVSNLYEMEMRLAWILDAAMKRGHPIDREYARSMSENLLEKSDALYDRIEREFGVRAGSNEQLVARFIEDGVKLVKTTDSGNFSVDAEVLEGLADKHPLAREVLSYRRAVKFRAAYYENVLNRLDSNDCIHCEIKANGAKTGRMSVSAPALQQIPSGDAATRRMFVYGEGNVGVSVDFANIEVRVLAHYAQEPALMAALWAGQDVHLAAAEMMYGKELAEGKRKYVKAGVFAKLYGSGPAKLAAQQGITVPEAKAFISSYDEMFPGVDGFVQAVQEAGAARYRSEGIAYVETLLGRRPSLDKWEALDRAFYKLTNYACQGTAADIMKLAIVEMGAAGLTDYFVLPVHDEVMSIVPRNEAADYAREVQAVMTGVGETLELSVPLGTDAEIYPESWGDCISGKFSPDEWEAHLAA